MGRHNYPGAVKRHGWTWFRTGPNQRALDAEAQTGIGGTPPVAPNQNYDYKRTPLFGRFSNKFNAFGPYRRPIVDATGGGELVQRQLLAYFPNEVRLQGQTPVAITGSGAQLTGQLVQMPLVDVSSNNSNNGSGNGGVVG